MVKYVTLFRTQKKDRGDYVPDYGEEILHFPSLAVYEDDDPQETGLIDKRGNSIFRVKERGKLGF